MTLTPSEKVSLYCLLGKPMLPAKTSPSKVDGIMLAMCHKLKPCAKSNTELQEGKNQLVLQLCCALSAPESYFTIKLTQIIECELAKCLDSPKCFEGLNFHVRESIPLNERSVQYVQFDRLYLASSLTSLSYMSEMEEELQARWLLKSL